MSLLWLSSLRGRLTASYVAALFLALVAFGAAAVVVIDRDLRSSLDARLRTTSQAALNFVDVKEGVAIDQHDREQLLALLGTQIEIAILDDVGGVVFSTTAKPSSDLVSHAQQAEGFATLQQSGADLRTLIVPIRSGDKRVGAVVAWATTDWISDTDRQVAIAFAVAALLLAAVAAIAGSTLAQRALEDAFARQRRFTTDASHELRAPLSVIRAEADLALRKPRDTSAYQSALSTIACETDRMEKLVSTLLVAARAQNARGDRSIIEASALARQVCERLRPAADVKQLRLMVREGSGCVVIGDADALQRALTAIVHNAIKHTPAGGGINVWAARRHANCELYVHDSGPGFSPAALSHGLEWFWREQAGDSNEATGLGLAIASSIVQAAGGHVMLTNAKDGGAQVIISLPAR